MNKLSFYDVKENYISYLKKFDNKIPNVKYDNGNKFFCGVVLQINDFKYYAPISSFKKKQKTNILIYDKDKIISSIRFSFMFPVPDSQLSIKNINESKDKNLLLKELKYCNSIREIVLKNAKRVYRYGTNPNHIYFNNCCNFKILELNCKAYK
jgi:protein AbiQ